MGTPLGSHLSPNHKQKIREGLLRYSATLSAAGVKRKGHTPWNKGKTSWSKGKHLSESHRAAIGAANKKAYQSTELRRAISERMRGPKNVWWKGGVNHKHYTERATIMNSFEYREWRRAVFKRDDYTCTQCGARSGNGKTVALNADHIKSFREHPECRFDLNNGRTLCVSCHKKTETYGFGAWRRKSDTT